MTFPAETWLVHLKPKGIVPLPKTLGQDQPGLTTSLSLRGPRCTRHASRHWEVAAVCSARLGLARSARPSPCGGFNQGNQAPQVGDTTQANNNVYIYIHITYELIICIYIYTYIYIIYIFIIKGLFRLNLKQQPLLKAYNLLLGLPNWGRLVESSRLNWMCEPQLLLNGC